MEVWTPTHPPAPSQRDTRRVVLRGRRRLSPSATRSYPARRAVPEDDCGLRTPFQRDRDRIVHCQAFRRLKHKTQVFVAPEGDHFRTRLTHTLEVTQISRTVARALGLNEDLDGGDRPRPRPRPPAVRPHRRGALDALPARALRRRLPPLRALAARRRRLEREGLNLTEPVRDGILCHSGRAPRAGDARGADRAARRPRRLHQPRHRRRAARGRARPRDLPRERDRRARATRARSASTRSSTTSWSTPTLAGDIVQGAEVGRGDGARCATFMFERGLPRRRRRAASTRRSRASSRRCSTTTPTTPSSCPRRRGAGPTSRSASPTTSPG